MVLLPAQAMDVPAITRVAFTVEYRTGAANGQARTNVEMADTPTNASRLNRIESKFTAFRYFAVHTTDQASMICQ